MTIDIIYNENCLDGLKTLPSESVNCCITSPPYYNLRDYGHNGQLGQENSIQEYISNLIKVFDEVYRILKTDGACWVNIGDVYADNKSLSCIPDLFKLEMIKRGWICRNEIIWHKPNAMPCSAKDRFNNDYEKMYFFTKSTKYYFETQYEPFKSVVAKTTVTRNKGKYTSSKQEASVRQGMNKERGSKLIEKRPYLPQQKEFVDFMRARTTRVQIVNETDLPKTKVDHWFRYDAGGFTFPSVEDWNIIKYLVDDWSEEFNKMDYALTEVIYETDDINKNSDKGRLKRAVWSINTKGFKGCHYAPYPEELVETPIKATCPENGIVLDPFIGSGTSAVIAKKLNRHYIGYELNSDYVTIANERIG